MGGGLATAVEFLTIINEKFEVLFTNHLLPGVESAVGLNCLDFLAAENQEVFRSAIGNAIATGLPSHFETESTGSDKVTSYYSSWATLLTGDTDEVRVALIGTDVSHVRRVEEELALSDETLRSLVTGASDYIAVVDREHKLSFINRVVHRDSVDEVLGQPVEGFLAESDRTMVRSKIDSVFRTGSFELRVV